MYNSSQILYFSVISAAFLLSAGLTPLVRRLALKLKITDKPESAERKVHQKATPLLGGAAVCLSSLSVMVIVNCSGLANFSAISGGLFFAIILASAIIMIGGFLDDKYDLKPYEQIIFPVSAIVVVLLSGLHIGYVTNPLGAVGAVIYFSGWIGVAIAGLWLLGMMYTTKFLDGLDGLASGVSVIASLFIFLTSLRWDAPLSATGIWALALLGASLGFLLFNWQPAKIFLGEGGSIFIGFMLAVLSILTGSKIITTLLVMGLPALDVLWVIVARLRHHKSPFSGDREHLHYRLLSLGLSKKQAVLIMYIIAIAFGCLGFISTSYGKMVLVLCLIAVMTILSNLLNAKRKQNDISTVIR